MFHKNHCKWEDEVLFVDLEYIVGELVVSWTRRANRVECIHVIVFLLTIANPSEESSKAAGRRREMRP